MNVLAIDTALEDCSVAIAAGPQVWLAERSIGRGHAEILMPAIAALLAEAGLSVRDLHRITVSTGPGSFTGLRVGISAARGLALPGGIAVIGIPTLQAHASLAAALRGECDRPILALLPARADELYGQLFSADAEPMEPLAIGPAAQFADWARSGGFDVAGAGAVLLGEEFTPLHVRSAPSVRTLLDLGARLEAGAYPPAPVYGKPPDAVPQHGGIARR